MIRPIWQFFKDIVASKRVIDNDKPLQGLIGVDTLLKNLITAKKVPGLAISVLKNGDTYFQKGYGFADIENKSPVFPKKTIFRIASVSKPIAAAALSQMVRDKIIDLDTSFYTYVPYYPKKKYDFTIRQLASHTAGIRGYRGKEYALNEPYSIKESIQIFSEDDLLFPPGTDYHYNSFDWVLLSLAMQEASGEPFEEYVTRTVLKPLGMHSVSPEIEHQENPHLTTFYTKSPIGFREAIPVNNFYKLAGGGYVGTAFDISKFGQSYLEHSLLPEKVSLEFLRSLKIEGKPTYYGLGWQVSEDTSGRPYFGHIGNGVGGYSNFFVYPDARMVVVILTNCTDPRIQTDLDEVINMLHRTATIEEI